MSTLLLWILYLGFGAAVLALMRWLKRPVPVGYAAALLILPVAFCAPGFFGARTLLPIDHVRIFPPWTIASSTAPRNANLNDAATQIAPWAKAVRMAWKERSLPWRNRWNGCGMALVANGQSAAFSPFTLLMLALPLARAFTLAVAVKLFLALAGVWLWLREMELPGSAALFGAVSFGFSMAMMPWLLFTLSGVICLWPWALFAVERLKEDPEAGRAWLLLVAVLAGSILAGHPESVILGLIMVGLFLGGRLCLADKSLARRAPAKLLTAGLLAAGLTGFLWVPQLSAIRASNRYSVAQETRESLSVTWAPHGPAWRYGFLTSIFPRILGDDLASPRLPGAAGSFPEMAFGYFGIVGWALALQIGRPGARRDKRELALVVPLVGGLAVGTGTWPVFDVLLSIPFVKLVLPLRSLSWASLAGSAIAAFEIERMSRDRGTSPRSLLLRLVPALALATAVTLAFWHFRAQHEASGGLAAQRGALWLSLVALALLSLLLVRWSQFSPVRDVIPFLMVAVTAGELFFQGARLYRWGSPADVFPPTPLVRFLQSQPLPFRVVGEGAALFPNTNVFAGVENIQTHDAIERRDYVTFLDETCGYDPKPYFKHIRDLDAPVLDFLNVRFLVTGNGSRGEDSRWKLAYSGADGRVFENRQVLPRVFAPRRIRFEGEAAPPESLARTDWSALATVREHPDVVGDRVVVAENVPIEVTHYRETTNSVRFLASSPGVLERPILVTSLVQDGGWKAWDEKGRRLTTVRANRVFLGLVMEAGRHEIWLDYSPPGLETGLVVSLASCLILVLWLWVSRRSGRDRGTT